MAHRFAALAFDYDGTLTEGRRPSPAVLSHLRATRATGTKLVLVTGRILAELRQAAPEVEAEFDAVVAENGAVLLDEDGVRDLAPPVDPILARALTHRDVTVRSGRVVLAGHAVDAGTALEEIGRLGLDCQLVRNRGELMILPSGITKGTGLAEALAELGVSRHSTLAVGDAENDLPLLEVAEVGVAVANAVDSLKRAADVVLERSDGDGVVELLTGEIVSGTRRVLPRRRQLLLGQTAEGNPVSVPASPHQLLVTGPSGAGKSFLVGLLIERLVQQQYGVLIIDREGDHPVLSSRRGLLTIGAAPGLPSPGEVVELLGHRFASVVADLSLLPAPDQDRFIAELLPLVVEHQLETGSPHWVVLDEAHEVGDHPAGGAPRGTGHILATHLPSRLPPQVRERIETIVVLPGEGDGCDDVRSSIGQLCGCGPQLLPLLDGLGQGQAVLVARDGSEPLPFHLDDRLTRHVRHWHKYTDAALPEHLRFLFGPEGCEGQATNVREFHRGLRRLSPDALTAHLHRHDLSRWLYEALRADALATSVSVIEHEVREGRRALEVARAELLAVVEECYLR